jgi:transposase
VILRGCNLVARLFDQGLGAAAVARRCGVCCQSASRWQKVWPQAGVHALKKAAQPGRPAGLSADDRAPLKAWLLQGPQAHSLATDLWLAAQGVQLIAERFGRRYHPDPVCRLLGQLGWSGQRPTTRASQREATAVRHWRRVTWPRLKKSLKRKADQRVCG